MRPDRRHGADASYPDFRERDLLWRDQTGATTGDGTIYGGNIDLEVRFRSKKGYGLITNLLDLFGAP